MSIFKAVNGTNRIDTLPDKIAYLIDPKKNNFNLLQSWMEAALVRECAPQYVFSDIGIQIFRGFGFFNTVVRNNQMLYGQPWKKAYDHFIIRFDKADAKVPPQQIYEALFDILFLFCHNMGGQYVGLMAYHFDTEIPHAHYLIDTIDFRNGHRRNLNRKEFCILRLRIARVLHSHGLTPLKFKLPKKKK